MNSRKLSGKNWFVIILFCFVGGIAWNTENMYFNTFLFNSVYGDASQAAVSGAMAPTTAVSRMVALSAVVCALSLIPLFFLNKNGYMKEPPENAADAEA